MPYLDGVKVTNAEWMAMKTGDPLNWRDTFGYNDGSESPSEISQAELEPIPGPDEAPPQTRRTRGKKAQAEAAVKAVTGLDIDLDDEIDATLVDTSGMPDDDEGEEEEGT